MRPWRQTLGTYAAAGVAAFVGAGWFTAPALAQSEEHAAHTPPAAVVSADSATHQGIIARRDTDPPIPTPSAAPTPAPQSVPTRSGTARLLDEIQELQDEVQEIQDGQDQPWILTYGAPVAALIGALVGASGAVGAMAYGKGKDAELAAIARSEERENLRLATVEEQLKRRIDLIRRLRDNLDEATTVLTEAREKWLTGGPENQQRAEELVLTSRRAIGDLQATKGRITDFFNPVDVYAALADNLSKTLRSGPAIQPAAPGGPSNIPQVNKYAEQLADAHQTLLTVLSAAEASVEDELQQVFGTHKQSSRMNAGSHEAA